MRPAARISAVVLAAGLSVRLGRFKPLVSIGGHTLIERAAALFRSAGVSDIVLVLGHRAPEVEAAAAPLQIRTVFNPGFREGMFSSVTTGLRHLPAACRAFFILPVDIPLVRSRTVRELIRARRERQKKIIYPAFRGLRGHPPLVDADLVPHILRWPGTGGLRRFLETHEAMAADVAVMDEAVLLDLDTPTDLDRLNYRAASGHIPTVEECRVLMEEIRGLPEAVVRHCRATAGAAWVLADAVNRAGGCLDAALACSAAWVHDIAKCEKDHARTGARLLADLGFPDLAAVVGMHMDIHVDDRKPVSEGEIVYLADKLLQGDQLVDMEQRFSRKMAALGLDPESADAVGRRRHNARRIRTKVETATGRTLEAILGGMQTTGGFP